MPRSGKNNEHTKQVPWDNKKTTNVESLRPQPKQLSELRRRAEKIAEDRIAKHSIKTVEDTSRLVHDLEVHQIELEMQNEEVHRTYKDLEDSRNKYSNLYDLAPVGYFTFDKNTCIVEANLTGCQMLGMERAYLIKKPFRLYISEDCQDRFYLHCRRVFETDTRQSCEISLVTKDGKKIEALLESVRAANTEGNNTLWRMTVTDITGLKLAGEKLQSEKNLLRTLIDHIPGDVYVKDKNGRFLDDDSLPLPEWFAATEKAWEVWPDADGIGGYIASEETDNIYSKVNADLFNWVSWESIHGGRPIFICTCNAGYKKSSLEMVGGFDESFKNAAGEDRDINIRLFNKNRVLRLDKNIAVFHDQGGKFNTFAARYFRYGKAVRFLRLKHS